MKMMQKLLFHLHDLNCAQVSDLLAAYLHAGLSSRQHTAVERHIQGCLNCQAELDASRRLEADLRIEASRHQPKISHQASARIQRDIYQRIRKSLIMRRFYQFAITFAVAAIVILLFIKGDAILRSWVVSRKSAAPIPATTASPLPTPATSPTVTVADSHIVVVLASWSDGKWVRNFNPFSMNGQHFSIACLYEPLMLQGDEGTPLTPWLATDYAWSDDHTVLTFTIRQGVKWSDGKDFSAEDVLATFNMLREHPEISGSVEYPHPVSTLFEENLASVSAPDDFTVQFKFKKVDTQAFDLLISIPIVPKHQWAEIEKPGEFANENPIGTGPFTQVTVFETRQNGMERTVQFERNPYYWQADQLAIDGVRYSMRHDEHAIKDLQNNLLDWAMLDLPDPQKDFTDLAPGFYHVGYSWNTATLLYLNTTHAPFENANIRKAISMAINREKILTLFPNLRVQLPSAVGLPVDEGKNSFWMEYNPQAANALLDEVGYTLGEDGIRTGPFGLSLRFSLYIANGGMQWFSPMPEKEIANLIAEDLKVVGIELEIIELEAYPYWEQRNSGDFDLLITEAGAGNEWFFASLMKPEGYAIYGSDQTNEDMGFYYSHTAQPLFEALSITTDLVRRQEILEKIQAIFVEDAPILPLYVNLKYYQYNTTRFTGFPSSEDPYASGIPYGWDALPVFMRLKPVQ